MMAPHPTNREVDTRPHVAVIAETFPYPTNSGYRLRTTNLLVRLSDHFRITLVAHCNEDQSEVEPAVEYFQQRGIRCQVVQRKPIVRRGIRYYANLLANLASPLPYQACMHATAEMRSAMQRLAANDPVDLWQCELAPLAELFRREKSKPWVMMGHNVETVIWQRLEETEANPIKRWYIRRQRLKMDRFERWVFSAANQTICVSHTDAALAQRMANNRCSVGVVENGVDTTAIRSNTEPRQPATILFLGMLGYRPNQDAVKSLLDTIFPTVRRAIPNAQLQIVGSQPPAWMSTRIAEVEGAVLHADVDSTLPYLQQSTVMAVPLRIGGGSRLKILEAAAAGLPCVSTRVGMEGLELIPDKHLLVVNSNDELASRLIQAIKQPERMRSLATAAREVVVAKYDWDILAEKLGAAWSATIAEDANSHDIRSSCADPIPHASTAE